jgi:hypothetical protein
MARKANLFEVAGGATSVTYATTGIAGQPSFHFRDADHDVNAEGTDIRTKKTELGTLVTIDVDVVADGPSTTATLVLPTVNLGDQTEQKLRTLGHHHHHGQHDRRAGPGGRPAPALQVRDCAGHGQVGRLLKLPVLGSTP